jgi:hypothetical protein
MEKINEVSELSDYLSLLYHEARNVRHLIKKAFLPDSDWQKLVTLPKNRSRAWKVIQKPRSQSKNSKTAQEACSVFQTRFDVGLDQLLVMFNNPNWKHARLYGGNAWANVAKHVIDLAQAIDNGNHAEAENILDTLCKARHNNGLLVDKLRDLDSSIELI